jgi:hypothetical protein
VQLAERLTALLVAIAALLAGLELLSLRLEFRAGGLADPAIATPPRQYVLVHRLSVGWLPALAGLEIALAAALAGLALAAGPLVVPTTLLAVVLIGQTQLFPSGRDGSDDMSVVVTVALALALIGQADTVIGRLAFAFIAAQLCLCYTTAGVSKLIGARWRSGDAFAGIMRTASYGHPQTAALIDRYPVAAKAVSWTVISGEIAFPVLFLVGAAAGIAALGIAALVIAAGFQLSVAVSMGLNRFVPWFLACYPAAVWTLEHATLRG